MEMPLVGKIIVVVVSLGVLYGTYSIGYYRGAVFVVESAKDTAVGGAINLKDWILNDKDD